MPDSLLANRHDDLSGRSQLIIAGHSHVNSYGGHGGHGPDDYTLNPIDESRGFLRLGGNPASAGYWETIIDLSRTRWIAVCWLGNQHNLHFMFLKSAFDFCLSTRPDLAIDPEVQLVPELEIREAFRPSFEGFAKILERMIAGAGPRPVILGTPPPKGDNDAFRAAMNSGREFYAQVAARVGLDDLATAPLAPVLLRYKLWYVMQQIMSEIAVQRGLEFWPVSERAMTVDGYLRREFWADDTTHANAAYGALMLDEYAKRLAALRAVGAS